MENAVYEAHKPARERENVLQSTEFRMFRRLDQMLKKEFRMLPISSRSGWCEALTICEMIEAKELSRANLLVPILQV
jgi:hypothetical protein